MFVTARRNLYAALASLVMLAAGLLTVAPAASVASLAKRVSATHIEHASTQPNANQALIRRLYTQVYNHGKVGLIDTLVNRSFVQHDPAYAAGRPGIAAQVRRLDRQTPRPVWTIKHILASGDLVVVHAQLSATPHNPMSGSAVMDLYRIADGQIVAEWGTRQTVPATTASGQSMFSNLYHYTSPPPPATPAQEYANQQLVEKVAVGVFTGHQTSLLDAYFGAYIQHDPRLPNGTAALKGALPSFPPEVLQVRAAVADGDLVYLYQQDITQGQSLASAYTGTAISDIYRVVNGKIVEHWDVLQTVPATSTNGNSMFSGL